MYKLYGIPGSCSTGIHILLNLLQQECELISKDSVDNYKDINPVGAVPVLCDGEVCIREGAAIALYLLEKHESDMLPTDLVEKSAFFQQLMFNYATLHPAYSRLFFAMYHFEGKTQEEVYTAGAKTISALWRVVDKQLESSRFVGGNRATIVDYLLCIYANWGAVFDVAIHHGPNVERMIKEASQHPEFLKAFQREGAEFALFRS